ncbi:MAG TPA: helix-turn-helix transcriptional regulator [Proteiniphilum sp.]|nr:helix-turn-helix transcriptional regulator [Proteiniphilum sp.]
MEIEHLSPTQFADRLQINRAVISHILNGRNNPSLDVVTKILGEMNYINPDWLLNGNGSIFKEGIDPEAIAKEPDLFHQDNAEQDKSKSETNHAREMAFKELPFEMKESDEKNVAPQKGREKKITQIIIYYDDNTFETFIPPLH